MRPFWKFNAAGNDFVLFFSECPEPHTRLVKEVANLCARHSGVGADGVVYLWRNAKKRFQWRFFNKDGTETSLCGNAARCVGLLLSQKFPKKKEWEWEGLQGLFRARKKNNQIEVSWPLVGTTLVIAPESLMEDLVGFNDRGLAAGYLIQVGVPHLVLVNFEVWNPPDRFANGPYLRRHPALKEEGANVTWLSLKTFETVTFERGVESETLACGSGALAAFLASREYYREIKKKAPTSLELIFPGGTLHVSQDKDRGYWVGGPTYLVFQGSLK